MNRLVISLIAVSALLAACGAPQAMPTTRAGKVALLAGKAADGATTFSSNCAACHGTDGKGKPMSGPDLFEPTRNDPAEEIIGYVLKGSEKMPAFDKLTDQQVADLYAHMKATFKTN